MDYFDQVDELPDLREGLHEDARAGQTTGLTNTPKDVAQSAQWFESSAFLGNGRTPRPPGSSVCNGKDVPKDLDLAMRWANSSLDAGYKSATKTVQLIQTIRAEKGLLPHGNI